MFRIGYRWIVTIFIVLLLFSSVAAVIFGSADISASQVVRMVFSKLPGVGKYISVEDIKRTSWSVVFQLRFPRIVLAVLVGAGLAVSGTVFQAVFQNPMAEPYTLGVSSGAALGATLAIVLGLQSTILSLWAPAVFAFLGALVATGLVYGAAGSSRSYSTTSLLLSGIALAFFMSAMMTFLMAINRDQADFIIFWMLGSFTSSQWVKVFVVAPVIVIGTAILILFSRDLNLLVMGDDSAKTLGLDADKRRKLLLGIASVLAASCVSMTGIIGFVGLIVPHAVRFLTGGDHRRHLPATLLAGGLFLLIADTLARNLIPPHEIPIGVITALIGSPVFLLMLRRSRR